MNRAGIAILAAAALGCAANMTLPRPTDPNVVALRLTPSAPVDAVVQVDNFSLGTIKTNFSNADMQQFRRDIPVKIGNDLFVALAGGQQFRAVKRTAAGPPADYIVYGTYDHTSYFGTRGREWIPLAGTFGAHINEATIGETIHISVKETASGRDVLNTSVCNEQEEWTSVYQQAHATWLEPHLIGQAAQAAAPQQEGSWASIKGINARVARVQFFVDENIDPDVSPELEQVCSSAKPASSFDSSSTTYIWYCVFVVPEGRFTEGSTSFAFALKREEDDSLVTWLPSVTLTPKSHWPFGMLFQGYGSRQAGEIPPDHYRIEIYANNELVGEGRFHVR